MVLQNVVLSQYPVFVIPWMRSEKTPGDSSAGGVKATLLVFTVKGIKYAEAPDGASARLT